MEESRLFDLQLWALSRGISTWLVDLQPWETCRVAGAVTRLAIDPEAGVIEASITDGTAVVRAEWAIRRPTPELSLAPGRWVVLEGTTSLDDQGSTIVTEPTYEVAREPEPIV